MADRDSIRSRRRTLSQQRASARSEESDQPDESEQPDQPDESEQSDEPKGLDRTSHSDPGDTNTTATLAPLADANPEQWLDLDGNTDLMVSLPNLGIDRIKLTVKNIEAHVQVEVKLLDLLHVKVGATASIEEIDLEIDNVRVQAMVKVQLEKVVEIVDRVMTTLEEHPDFLRNLTQGSADDGDSMDELEAGAGAGADSGDDENPTADSDSEQEDTSA